jgi:hypothetical protein
MKDRQCSRCGKKLPPGSLAYVFHVRAFADFDGVIVEPEEAIDPQVEKLLRQIERQDPKELEKEVHEEFSLLLCKRCRDRFVKELRHPWEGPCPGDKDSGYVQ